MAEYFTANDLRARLNKTACWIHEEAECINGRIKTEGRIDNCRMNNLSIVVAMWQAAECYTPITSEAEDGVVNCLTEAEEEQLFDNISTISGICFVPKGIEWILEVEDDLNQTSKVKNALGEDLVDGLGNPITTGNAFAQADELASLAEILASNQATGSAINTGNYTKLY